MNIRNSTLFVLICLLAACDPGSQRRLDRETMEREQRLREPRRIKEAEIVEKAVEQGALLVSLLHKSSSLPADSSRCCLQTPTVLVDSLQQHYTAAINCYSLRKNALPATLQPKEREILDAYSYAIEQNLSLEPNIQPLGKEEFLYTAPVTNGDTTKKSCAVWSIRLSRKQLVLSM